MTKKVAIAGAAILLALGGYASTAMGGEPESAEGTIYHYVRSNTDGSDAEHVYVYRAAENHLEVYKMRERCEPAAFVSAWVDPETGTASLIDGGRLMPNARHENFVSLHYDGTYGRLSVEATLPDRMVRERVRVEQPVYHLYDFDLASLSLQTMALDDVRQGFSFGLPLIWTEPSEDGHLRQLGEARATYVGEEEYRGRRAIRFEVDGPALGDQGGPLWIDAEGRHVIGAEWGLPNHAGMEDFAIRLVDIERSGEAGWTALLTSHFEGCETI